MTDFDIDEWLGEWTSFEALIDDGSPAMERTWAQSEEAMRGRRSAFTLMLPFFGGSMRRFWRWACRTGARWQRGAVDRWRVERPELVADGGSADGDSADGVAFVIVWWGRFPDGRGGFVRELRRAYRLDHMVAKGLEGKPCLVFHAVDAHGKGRHGEERYGAERHEEERCGAERHGGSVRKVRKGGGDPFRVLIAMEPMPGRKALAGGGLLSHLHFQYACSEDTLLRGHGAGARIRHRMWYPTMVAAEGDEFDRCNVVRALHGLPALERGGGRSS